MLLTEKKLVKTFNNLLQHQLLYCIVLNGIYSVNEKDRNKVGCLKRKCVNTTLTSNTSNKHKQTQRKREREREEENEWSAKETISW